MRISTVTLAAALAGGLLAGPAPAIPIGPPTGPVADQPGTVDAGFAAFLRLAALPPILKWQRVEANASGGYVAHGVVLDTTSFRGTLTEIPLGDLAVTGVRIDAGYLVHFEARATGSGVDFANLVTLAQRMGQAASPAPGAPTSAKPNDALAFSIGLAMFASLMEGFGYKDVPVTIDIQRTNDLNAGTERDIYTVDLSGLGRLTYAMSTCNVTRAYFDWFRAQGLTSLLDQSPEQRTKRFAAFRDKTTPLAHICLPTASFAFADEGVMSKLAPMMATARQQIDPPGGDEKAKAAAAEAFVVGFETGIAAKTHIPADRWEPVARAVMSFILAPKLLSITAHFDPPLTFGTVSEIRKSPPPGTGLPPIDWRTHITFDASN